MTLPIRNGRIRIGQSSVFWRETGYGSTVIFLHGNWQGGEQWLPLMQALGQHLHCLAPDLLGFGESSQLMIKHYSIQAELDCLTEYLTSLRVHPQILVAEAIGAWVAIRYCLQHPDRVKGLVLTAPEGLTHPLLARRWRGSRWLSNRWALRFWLLQLLSPLIKALGKGHWLQSIRQRRRQLRRHTATCRLLFQRRKSEIQAESLNAALPHLNLPVLILSPEGAAHNVQLANTLCHQMSPNAELITIPGHDAEQVAATVKAVQTFIDNLNSGDRPVDALRIHGKPYSQPNI
ncbi:MAG: alpha/beta hydrolase [Cyanobacteria bacterium P01_H01_bin.58]